ncbi:MAG: phage holin family protein [Clostridia bacterium]
MCYLELVCVPTIAFIVYGAIEIGKKVTKQNVKFKQFIPVIAIVLGAILGIVSYYTTPSTIAAESALMAIIIGAVSGLTATGTNQIFKQIIKHNENNQTIIGIGLEKKEENIVEKEEAITKNEIVDKKITNDKDIDK